MQRTSLSGCGICLVCLIRVWRDESKQQGFFAWKLNKILLCLQESNKICCLINLGLSPDFFFGVTSPQKHGQKKKIMITGSSVISLSLTVRVCCYFVVSSQQIGLSDNLKPHITIRKTYYDKIQLFLIPHQATAPSPLYLALCCK